MPVALEVVIPGLTALAGAAYGARTSALASEHSELRSLLDDATAVLARAGQQRGVAYGRFVQEGLQTTPDGIEALNAFRRELSEADQLRGKLVFRTPTNSSVSVHYLNALLALGRVSEALGVAAIWPNDEPDARTVQDLSRKLQQGELDFAEEHAAFLEAAQRYFDRSLRGRLRRRRR